VLSAVLETAPAERSSYLNNACADDPALRLDIESLLAVEEEAGDVFLSATSSAAIPGANDRIGQRIGAYQMVEKIGAGGMGEVYRAFRDDDHYKKEVAIKLVRTGQGSTFVMARFRNERQVRRDETGERPGGEPPPQNAIVRNQNVSVNN
jgi:hypothetical protein